MARVERCCRLHADGRGEEEKSEADPRARETAEETLELNVERGRKVGL